MRVPKYQITVNNFNPESTPLDQVSGLQSSGTKSEIGSPHSHFGALIKGRFGALVLALWTSSILAWHDGFYSSDFFFSFWWNKFCSSNLVCDDLISLQPLSVLRPVTDSQRPDRWMTRSGIDFTQSILVLDSVFSFWVLDSGNLDFDPDLKPAHC